MAAIISQESNGSIFTENNFGANVLGSAVVNYTTLLNRNNSFAQNVGVIIANETTIALGQTIQFTDLISDQFSLGFQWNFTDGTANSTIANPIHIFNMTGLFEVGLSAIDSTGQRLLRKYYHSGHG